MLQVGLLEQEGILNRPCSICQSLPIQPNDDSIVPASLALSLNLLITSRLASDGWSCVLGVSVAAFG
jgi:hypothetical protein